MAKTDDDEILREMLGLANRLCADEGDALMIGQYRFLRSRIDALLTLRGAAADAA